MVLLRSLRAQKKESPHGFAGVAIVVRSGFKYVI